MFGKWSTKTYTGQLARAEATFSAACAARDTGEVEKALSLALLAAERAEAARGRRLARQGFELAADLLVSLGETDQAIQMYRQALRASPEPAADLQTLVKLIPLLRQQGRTADARQAAGQACALAERLHERTVFSVAVHWLAYLDYEQENWTVAEAHFHAALTASYQTGEPSLATRAALLLDLGHAVAQQQRLAEAADWLAQCVAVADRAGEPELSVDGRHSLAVVWALSGDPDRATGLLTECLALQRGRGDAAGCAETLSELARVSGLKGTPTPTRAAAKSAPVGRPVLPALPA